MTHALQTPFSWGRVGRVFSEVPLPLPPCLEPDTTDIDSGFTQKIGKSTTLRDSIFVWALMSNHQHDARAPNSFFVIGPQVNGDIRNGSARHMLILLQQSNYPIFRFDLRAATCIHSRKLALCNKEFWRCSSRFRGSFSFAPKRSDASLARPREGRSPGLLLDAIRAYQGQKPCWATSWEIKLSMEKRSILLELPLSNASRIELLSIKHKTLLPCQVFPWELNATSTGHNSAMATNWVLPALLQCLTTASGMGVSHVKLSFEQQSITTIPAPTQTPSAVGSQAPSLKITMGSLSSRAWRQRGSAALSTEVTKHETKAKSVIMESHQPSATIRLKKCMAGFSEFPKNWPWAKFSLPWRLDARDGVNFLSSKIWESSDNKLSILSGLFATTTSLNWDLVKSTLTPKTSNIGAIDCALSPVSAYCQPKAFKRSDMKENALLDKGAKSTIG